MNIKGTERVSRQIDIEVHPRELIDQIEEEWKRTVPDNMGGCYIGTAQDRSKGKVKEYRAWQSDVKYHTWDTETHRKATPEECEIYDAFQVIRKAFVTK